MTLISHDLNFFRWPWTCASARILKAESSPLALCVTRYLVRWCPLSSALDRAFYIVVRRCTALCPCPAGAESTSCCGCVLLKCAVTTGVRGATGNSKRATCGRPVASEMASFLLKKRAALRRDVFSHSPTVVLAEFYRDQVGEADKSYSSFRTVRFRLGKDYVLFRYASPEFLDFEWNSTLLQDSLKIAVVFVAFERTFWTGQRYQLSFSYLKLVDFPTQRGNWKHVWSRRIISWSDNVEL